MKIEFTQDEIKAMIAIINNANITGAAAEFIVALKKKFVDEVKEEETK